MRGFDPIILAKYTEQYPQQPRITKGEIWSDEFNREALNTSGAVTLYTSATTGTGTATIANSATLRLTTSVAASDDVDVRTSGIKFQRASNYLDTRSIIEFDVVYQPGQVTDTELFNGILLDAGAAITALPTTTRHMGLQLDISASGNYFTTSSDGTTQTTEDTGVLAEAATRVRLNIIWNSLDGGSIRLYTGAALNTLSYTDTVSALDQTTNFRSYGMHFFIQDEAALAAKTMDISEWGFQVR